MELCGIIMFLKLRQETSKSSAIQFGKYSLSLLLAIEMGRTFLMVEMRISSLEIKGRPCCRSTVSFATVVSLLPLHSYILEQEIVCLVFRRLPLAMFGGVRCHSYR